MLKIKYHLLAHLRQDILRFGPLVGVATETYESFNAIFRFCSILSNHLAPSRDIAFQLAEQEVLRHLLSGGHWLDQNGCFKQAGAQVVGFLARNTFLQTLLGYGRAEAFQVPGMCSPDCKYHYNELINRYQVQSALRPSSVPKTRNSRERHYL